MTPEGTWAQEEHLGLSCVTVNELSVTQCGSPEDPAKAYTVPPVLQSAVGTTWGDCGHWRLLVENLGFWSPISYLPVFLTMTNQGIQSPRTLEVKRTPEITWHNAWATAKLRSQGVGGLSKTRQQHRGPWAQPPSMHDTCPRG